MRTSDFKDLRVWQQSMDLVTDIYRLLDNLPKEERYGLADQIRRCSVSIPSNIAEGQARNSNKEFIHFLSISRGSLAELETQLILCIRLKYFDDAILIDIFERMKNIDKMIVGLMGVLKK
ncbi:MAG: four helix bundle protein [Muribaculaceae bacterium]|nr:four helix bundle protein [Muribaculaceae bacterium]